MVDIHNRNLHRYCTGAYASKSNAAHGASKLLQEHFDRVRASVPSDPFEGEAYVGLRIDIDKRTLVILGASTAYDDGYVCDEWEDAYGLEGKSLMSLLRSALDVIDEVLNPSDDWKRDSSHISFFVNEEA